MKRALATRTAALAALFLLALAPNARAATLDFTGTLSVLIGSGKDYQAGIPNFMSVSGGGTAVVNASGGGSHLNSLSLAGGSFGPSTVTVPGFYLPFGTGFTTFQLTLTQNQNGSFSGLSGGAPGGGTMGLSGVAKICMTIFAPCPFSNIPLPLTPTTGGVGFGIGGTRTVAGAIGATLQHAPWTIGQPALTIHTASSSVTSPVLPGGFAHGPASLTSSTARPSGVVQLVTVSKVYTTLTFAYPELPLTGVLTLRFVPEPGTLLLVGSGVALLAALGSRRGKR